MNTPFDDDPAVLAAHDRLVADGALVRLDPAESRAWMDHDLASLAENRLGDRLDPPDLDASRRERWLAQATREGVAAPSRRLFERCYWILEGAERVGTIALATNTLGAALVPVSSLYIRPGYRDRGAGTRTLARVRDAFAAQSFGLRLTTCWAWQPAIRFYLRMGLWVRGWKRNLDLQLIAEVPRVRVEEGSARISVLREGAEVVLWEAERQGDRLSLREGDASREGAGDLMLDGLSTLSLALAVRGWPLVRSDEAWEHRFSDLGPPEALAYRITLWEAWDRKHGWQVHTPRIPGLAYPSWDELQSS